MLTKILLKAVVVSVSLSRYPQLMVADTIEDVLELAKQHRQSRAYVGDCSAHISRNKQPVLAEERWQGIQPLPVLSVLDVQIRHGPKLSYRREDSRLLVHARSDLEAFEPLGPLSLSLLGLHWWWWRWWRLGRWCGCRQRVRFGGGKSLQCLVLCYCCRHLVSLDLFVVMELAAASRARPHLFVRRGCAGWGVRGCAGWCCSCVVRTPIPQSCSH